MPNSSRLFFVFLFLIFSLHAKSGVITHADYVWDDSTNFVSNATTGLQWLRWSETGGQSIDRALASYSGYGYRVASFDEVRTLYVDFFLGTQPSIWPTDENSNQGVGLPYDGNDGYHGIFLKMFGAVRENYCFENIPNQDCAGDPINSSYAYFGEDLDGDGLYNYAQVKDENKIRDLATGITRVSGEYSSIINDSFPSSSFSSNFGVALVRDQAVISVSEPSSLSLLSLALLGLLKIRKRKH